MRVRDPEKWAAFVDSDIYADIKAEFRDWAVRVAQEYDTCDGLLALGKIQGRREAMAYAEQIGEALLEDAISLKESNHATQKQGSSAVHEGSGLGESEEEGPF